MNDEVEKNIKLVTFVLKKYYKRYDEDLFQIGCMGLIKAVRTFDKNKNVKKSVYYSKCIYTEIGKYLRENNTIKRGRNSKILSLDYECDTTYKHISNEKCITLYDTVPSSENIENDFIKREDIKLLLRCIKHLSKQEQMVLTYTFELFGKNKKTQIELGEILKMSQANISRILTRALKKLRGMMKNESNN